MDNIEKLYKIQKLHKLIQSDFRGTTNDYAKQLNISRACFFNYKESIENAGAVIEYLRNLNKYIYLNEFHFEIRINYSTMSKEKMKKIKGGKTFFVQSIFLD